MTRPTYNLSLRDRNLIRLQRHERVENFHAQRMAKNGDVELFVVNAQMDDDEGGFPYPYGKGGKRKIDSLNISNKGNARLDELYLTDRTNYDAYHGNCHIKASSYDHEQILYTPQGIVNHVNFGKRDILLVHNRKVQDDDEFKREYRSTDPDTEELLISVDELYGFDNDEDEDNL